jgi:hypothetical protein
VPIGQLQPMPRLRAVDMVAIAQLRQIRQILSLLGVGVNQDQMLGAKGVDDLGEMPDIVVAVPGYPFNGNAGAQRRRPTLKWGGQLHFRQPHQQTGALRLGQQPRPNWIPSLRPGIGVAQQQALGQRIRFGKGLNPRLQAVFPEQGLVGGEIAHRLRQVGEQALVEIAACRQPRRHPYLELLGGLGKAVVGFEEKDQLLPQPQHWQGKQHRLPRFQGAEQPLHQAIFQVTTGWMAGGSQRSLDEQHVRLPVAQSNEIQAGGKAS